MRLDRVLAIAKKNLRSLKHDKRTIGFLVFMPLMMIAIFGYTFGGDVKDLSVQIVNLDSGTANGSLAEDLIEKLETMDTFSIVGIDSEADRVSLAIESVQKTDIWAAIVIEENFTQNLLLSLTPQLNGSTSDSGNITVYIDGSNPNVAQAVLVALQDALQELSDELTEQFEIGEPVNLQAEMIYGEDAEFIDFFAPGVMGLAAMIITFMISILSFVRERSGMTLDRLLASPVTEGEIVAGYALAFGIVGLVQACVILATAVLLFQVNILGNVLLVLFILVLLAIGSQGMGFLLSSMARSEFQAVQFAPLVFIPSILLAGVFWPIEAIPEFLRPISALIPLTYAVEGCRSVMLRGWGVEEVLPEIAILLCFAVAMLLISTLMLKRRG